MIYKTAHEQGGHFVYNVVLTICTLGCHKTSLFAILTFKVCTYIYNNIECESNSSFVSFQPLNTWPTTTIKSVRPFV